MTFCPLRYTCDTTKDTYTFTGQNISSGESDEIFVWWRKFRPTRYDKPTKILPLGEISKHENLVLVQFFASVIKIVLDQF